jgi:hypothetical protein
MTVKLQRKILLSSTEEQSSVLADIVTQCCSVGVFTGVSVVLNLFNHLFKCASVNSISVGIINTKIGITALDSSFL